MVDKHRGWEISEYDEPVTGKFVAKSFGVKMSAGSRDAIVAMIDQRIKDYPPNGHGGAIFNQKRSKMTLKQFAAQNLNIPSSSTNPAHKRFVNLTALDNVSDQLTEDQYKLCKDFIDNDFNFDLLDDSEVETPA